MALITTAFYNLGGSLPPPLAMVVLITPFTSMLHTPWWWKVWRRHGIHVGFALKLGQLTCINGRSISGVGRLRTGQSRLYWTTTMFHTYKEWKRL